MMGWMAPLRHRDAKLVSLENHQEREPSMSEITTIGLDLAKHVFQVHGIDAQGTTVLRKRLRRGQVLAFFSRIPPCLVGLEACATAHYWGRELAALGHEVRLMPAQYVKAYIKRNKTDAADAEAICEAVQRPRMRFVPVKTAEQQASQLLHRGREQLVRQRTMLVNALRAHLAEFGLVAAQGLRNVGELIAIVRDDDDRRVPDMAREVLQVLANQIEQIEAAIAALERQLLAWHKTNPVSQRLASNSGDWADHRYGNRIHGGRPKCLSLRAGVRRLAGLGAEAEFNRRQTPAGRHHKARQSLSAPAAHQWGKRQSAAIEGDQSRSMGDPAAPEAAAAGRRRGTGQQDGADRLGGDVARERIPAPGSGGLVRRGRRWSLRESNDA
jgi:hypothetical protein